MGQRIIPVLPVGAVVLAVITAHVLNIPFRKDGTSLLLVIAFLLPGIFLAQLIAVLLRKKKIRDWFATEGTIQSCDEDSFYKGIQSYRCSYVYRPDDTRQGGTFLISEPAAESDDRLHEIRKELIGRSVRVRYDPKDYTRSMVEDKQVMRWGVESD
jgi:hypothetical protein